MAIRVVEFSNGGYKIRKIFAYESTYSKEIIKFENWVSGEVSKSAKSPNLLTFKMNFLCQKLSESFSIFFFIKEYQFRSTFFVIDKIFKSLYLLKWCPIFDTSPLTQFSKFNNTLMKNRFFRKSINIEHWTPPNILHGGRVYSNLTQNTVRMGGFIF
jgi:hypothetical protein